MKEAVEIQILKSRRKSIAIEITTDGEIRVRAPFFLSDAEIQQFLQEKEDWIAMHVKKAKEHQRRAAAVKKLTAEEKEQLTGRAGQVIPARVRHYAAQMGVSYGRITIRMQKTRWGSCSAKGNLNFNGLLMLAPEMVLDYVVVHELCHLLEMNHSSVFWQQVERVMPDYRMHRKWLKDHGQELMGRVF